MAKLMGGMSDIVVLDFSKLLPGPFCSLVLADLGCRVIRVELPHWKDAARDIPPRIQGHGFCYWMANRNKESLCLDFRKPEGLSTLLKLVAKADVLLEGFRPGLMDRLGLGYRELSRKHKRLVYCSLTGYGQQGPLSAKAGHDLNFMAQAGSLGLGDSSGGVTFPPIQTSDLAGSLYAALGILAALRERECVRGELGARVAARIVAQAEAALVRAQHADRACGLRGRDPHAALRE